MLTDFSLFKELETHNESRLSGRGLAIVRLDGSNFSKYTKQFKKPFSLTFEKAMDAAAQAVMENVLPNTLVCYVGSDEISLVISQDYSQVPYGGRISKLLSLAASHATAGFISAIGQAKGVPAFDARIIEFQDSTLIREYITWRRLDVRKNATSMAAGHLHSHKELLGVSTAERGKLLEGTEFEVIPEGTFNGRFVTKETSTPATRELAEELAIHASRVHEEAIEAKSYRNPKSKSKSVE